MDNQLNLFAINDTFFIHKLSGERLKFIKLYGGCVAKCEIEKEIIITQKPYLAIKTTICHIDNLIPTT